MGWFWILLICIVAVIVAVMRWLLAGGRRRSPGRELPERPPPT